MFCFFQIWIDLYDKIEGRMVAGITAKRSKGVKVKGQKFQLFNFPPNYLWQLNHGLPSPDAFCL